MGIRKEMRVDLELPIRVSGLDAAGDIFEQDAFTINITPAGAQIWGVYRSIKVGTILVIQHRLNHARFRVIWTGIPNTPSEGRIGVELMDTGRYIWGQGLQRILGDDYDGPRSMAAASAD